MATTTVKNNFNRDDGSSATAGIAIGDIIAGGLMIYCFVMMSREIYYFYQNWGKSTSPSRPSRADPRRASSPNLRNRSETVSIASGTIIVQEGDLTTEQVDMIVGSSSSDILKEVILSAGGPRLRMDFESKNGQNADSDSIDTEPGLLRCQRVLFLRWQPSGDDSQLRQSVSNFVSNAIDHAVRAHYRSMAFPAIGCGDHACSVDIIVETMVTTAKKELNTRAVALTVKFIIQPSKQNVYNEFCKHLFSTDQGRPRFAEHRLPSTWVRGNVDQIRFVVDRNTTEFKNAIRDFQNAMHGHYSMIIKLERIQNERAFIQYMAHKKDFQRRLGQNTERQLYHGCPEKAANAIIDDCFNRSFAGVNGTLYGVGVYFSSKPDYSHGYTKPNYHGERCMFIACVLIGKTTKGHSSMKTRPVGFDSTTDGDHIFVTYHDAQAYAEYLITYR